MMPNSAGICARQVALEEKTPCRDELLLFSQQQHGVLPPGEVRGGEASHSADQPDGEDDEQEDGEYDESRFAEYCDEDYDEDEDPEIDAMCLEQACRGVMTCLYSEVRGYAVHYVVPEEVLMSMVEDWFIYDLHGLVPRPPSFYIEDVKLWPEFAVGRRERRRLVRIEYLAKGAKRPNFEKWEIENRYVDIFPRVRSVLVGKPGCMISHSDINLFVNRSTL
jgi:hypothetical protein